MSDFVIGKSQKSHILNNFFFWGGGKLTQKLMCNMIILFEVGKFPSKYIPDTFRVYIQKSA